jgi:hypothetical protein
MASSDLDAYAFALEAMATVLSLIAARKGDRSGDGKLPCPQCKGTLHYAFHRQPGRGRHRLTYSAICETTEKCISFRGH